MLHLTRVALQSVRWKTGPLTGDPTISCPRRPAGRRRQRRRKTATETNVWRIYAGTKSCRASRPAIRPTHSPATANSRKSAAPGPAAPAICRSQTGQRPRDWTRPATRKKNQIAPMESCAESCRFFTQTTGARSGNFSGAPLAIAICVRILSEMFGPPAVIDFTFQRNFPICSAPPLSVNCNEPPHC